MRIIIIVHTAINVTILICAGERSLCVCARNPRPALREVVGWGSAETVLVMDATGACLSTGTGVEEVDGTGEYHRRCYIMSPQSMSTSCMSA